VRSAVTCQAPGRGLVPGPAKTKVSAAWPPAGCLGADEVFKPSRGAERRGADIVLPGRCMGFCQREPLVSVAKAGWPRTCTGGGHPEGGGNHGRPGRGRS